MTPGKESRGMPAPSASPGRLAAAGWGSLVAIHFTSAALRALSRPAAMPSAVPCVGGRLQLKSGTGWMPGRPPRMPKLRRS
eukprot:10731560-Alexandrium_andersonii.AAC.1